MSMSNHECTGVAQFTTIKQGMSESALPEYKQMTGIFDLNKSIANTNIFLYFTLTVLSRPGFQVRAAPRHRPYCCPSVPTIAAKVTGVGIPIIIKFDGRDFSKKERASLPS